MPARSNEFQRLVGWIQRSLAPDGAIVTESAMVESPILNGQREIDILIKGPFGPYSLKIAVEAKDEKRKLDLVRFDSIVQKYAKPLGIAVDKVVIVTRSGFTAAVLQKAKMLGVELFTLREATFANWKSVASGSCNYQVAPHICAVSVNPAVSGDPRELMQFGQIFCTHGKNHGTLRDFAAHVAFRHVFATHKSELAMLNQAARADSRGAMATFEWPLTHHFLRYGDKNTPVASMTVCVHAVNSKGVASATSYVMQSSTSDNDKDRSVMHVQMRAAGKRMDLVLPDGMQSQKISLSISDDDSCSHTPQDSR